MNVLHSIPKMTNKQRFAQLKNARLAFIAYFKK